MRARVCVCVSVCVGGRVAIGHQICALRRRSSAGASSVQVQRARTGCDGFQYNLLISFCRQLSVTGRGLAVSRGGPALVAAVKRMDPRARAELVRVVPLEGQIMIIDTFALAARAGLLIPKASLISGAQLTSRRNKRARVSLPLVWAGPARPHPTGSINPAALGFVSAALGPQPARPIYDHHYQ